MVAFTKIFLLALGASAKLMKRVSYSDILKDIQTLDSDFKTLNSQFSTYDGSVGAAATIAQTVNRANTDLRRFGSDVSAATLSTSDCRSVSYYVNGDLKRDVDQAVGYLRSSPALQTKGQELSGNYTILKNTVAKKCPSTTGPVTSPLRSLKRAADILGPALDASIAFVKRQTTSAVLTDVKTVKTDADYVTQRANSYDGSFGALGPLQNTVSTLLSDIRKAYTDLMSWRPTGTDCKTIIDYLNNYVTPAVQAAINALTSAYQRSGSSSFAAPYLRSDIQNIRGNYSILLNVAKSKCPAGPSVTSLDPVPIYATNPPRNVEPARRAQLNALG